jgi:hypothetical protein
MPAWMCPAPRNEAYTSSQLSFRVANRSSVGTEIVPPVRTVPFVISTSCRLRSKPLSERR